MIIELVKLHQTCEMCPSQWDAWDKEGNYYYIRYRFGVLTVAMGEEWPRKYIHDEDLTHIYGPFGGIMTTKEMLNRTGLKYVEQRTTEDKD